MSITRRQILAAGGSALVSRILRANVQGNLERVLNASTTGEANRNEQSEIRKYVANATVTLFSIPLVSKSGVGSGYAVVEQAGRTVAIQFGAGSWPESARGLNRLGFIQEGVIEERPGSPAECAWLAFMTTSQEKNLEQAKKALEASGGMVPYSASKGYGKNGSFASRLDRLEFPSHYTWRDLNPLVAKARQAMTGDAPEQQDESDYTDRPATFLYMVRKAMLDAGPRTTGSLVFNQKEFRLDTQKEADASAAAHFAGKELVAPSAAVTRMNAVLTRLSTGEKTPFRLWYEAGAAPGLPLRFEYQAKPFLRLTFEADPKAVTPPIQFAFTTSKEAA